MNEPSRLVSERDWYGSSVKGRERERTSITKRRNKISIDNLCLWHFGACVCVLVSSSWCLVSRYFHWNRKIFIFNPSNFLFGARFYLCGIDPPDPHTHTQTLAHGLFVFVTIIAPFASIQLYRFLFCFIFRSWHFCSDAMFNVVILKRTWTHTHTHAERRTRSRSMI